MKLFKYPRDYKESDEGMPMKPESIKPKQALFNKPESRKSRQYICNIYSLIYQRPVSAEVMERAAITECNEKLYGFVTDFWITTGGITACALETWTTPKRRSSSLGKSRSSSRTPSRSG